MKEMENVQIANLRQKTQTNDFPFKRYRTEETSAAETDTENKKHHEKQVGQGKKNTTRRRK
jgi:hypothetical protein